MSGEKKEGGALAQVFVAIVIALLAGGTAPWWWDKFFESSPATSPSPTTSLPSNVTSPQNSDTPTPPSPTVSSNQQRLLTTSVKQVKEDAEVNLQFGLQGCQRSSNVVTCYVLVTKQADVTEPSQGRGYYIYANYPNFNGVSRAFTSDGEEHSAQVVQAGDKTGKYIDVNLIKGIPMRISISFDIPLQFQSLNAFAMQYKFENVDIFQ
jgi:hypothetical protein